LSIDDTLVRTYVRMQKELHFSFTGMINI
jgi:hypothetical protein